MKIRGKLLVSHGVPALVVVVVCGLILLLLETMDRNRRSLEESYEHLREINELNSDTNRLSEQIAELFTVGLSGHDEMVDAWHVIDRRLADLELRIDGEIAQARNAERRQREIEMLRWIGELRVRTTALSTVSEQIYQHLRAGDLAQAQRLYAVRVEDGLDSEISDLIAGAMTTDEVRVLEAIASWDRVTEVSRILAIGVAVAAAVLAVGNALVMDRLVSRPLIGLAQATDDLAEGRARVPLQSGRRDELAHLAERFEEMAARIGEQQEKLRAARDRLEAEVAARTADLSQRSAELEAANARLTELDASRTRFFADVSHELRTPLTVLRGQAEIALRQPADNPAGLRAALEQVTRKADHMGRLVDDLLFLARSEAGVLEFRLRPSVMQDVLAEVVLDASALTDGRGVRLSLRQPPDPLIVAGDPERLRQAVVILLDNAIRHAPEGSVVKMELGIDNDTALLRVVDQGEGIAEADRERVFDRFYRGRNSSGRRGTGLGLPIARDILRRHGGTIRIAQGAAGKGATVEIRLPLIAA